MIIVMETDATREQVNGIVARVKALGLGAHLSEGEERTIIGVVGSPLPPSLDDELEIHSGVERVVRITKKYKLTGWDFHPQKTDDRGPRRRHRRRRRDDHRRSLLGRERRADCQHGTGGQGRRRDDPARRRLQAAHLPLRVPRAGTPRPRDPRHGTRGDRPADHHRGDDAERRRPGRRSTPTSSRSAPATPRTTSCWKRSARPASRSCSSAACRC